ncbi:LysR substrate-binding domain-containing protein [Sphingomonas sp. RP10(2022)]|uniref:LysR substrate-binding domain-containing protein n=1 Tax=Sphingomonas liriopis TaxID=2949094 RepID=A0A9X2HSE4_9SPHN|nr:LysR substrate-binding domain-containing protein [Sphingomonas liriopis]MCP3733446.1 LysR substrate-binding domain-containing protein [Sphingomonas liriopis]
MNLRHIEIFHAVYVNGTVSAAARALAISQPAVTKTLRHAEQQLGFALFLRHRNRLVPTEDAHALFGEVADVQARIGSLRQAARNLRRGHGGALRISTLPSLGLDLVPQAAARFLADRPGTFFDLQITHHDEIVRRLYERETDAVVAIDVPRDMPLSRRWLGEGELGVLYRAGDLDEGPGRIDLATIADRSFVSLERSGPLGDLFAAETQRLDLDLAEIASARTFYVAAALVRAGVGMAVVDSFTAAAMTGPALRFRPLRPSLAFDIVAITLEARPPSALMNDFLATLAALIEQP